MMTYAEMMVLVEARKAQERLEAAARPTTPWVRPTDARRAFWLAGGGFDWRAAERDGFDDT